MVGFFQNSTAGKIIWTLSALAFFVGTFITNQQAFAKPFPDGTTVVHFGHYYKPNSNLGLHQNKIATFVNSVEGMSASLNQNFSGMNRTNLIGMMANDMKAHSGAYLQAVEFTGHGDPGSYYTASGFKMYDQIRITTEALQAANAHGFTIISCCGSGNIADFQSDPSQVLGDGLNNLFAVSSSAPRRSSSVGDGGSIEERMLTIYKNIGTYDSNKDGVLSVSEMKEAFKERGYPNQFVVPKENEEAPVFAATKQAMEEYMKKWLGSCGVVTPGQSKGSGYDALLGDEKVYPRDGKPDALHNIQESEINKKLRDKQLHFLRMEDAQASQKDPVYAQKSEEVISNYRRMIKQANLSDSQIGNITWMNDTGKEDGMITPQQAAEALGNDRHAYTVKGGKVMQPFIYTKGMIANDNSGQPVRVSRTCEFKSVEPPNPAFNNPNPPGGGDTPGGGGGGGLPQVPGGGSGGGSGNQANPSPTPTPQAGYTCPTDYTPVCDERGNTQPNACIAQQKGLRIAYDGACGSANPESILDMSILSQLIEQLFESGMPQNLIESVVRVIAPLISNFFTNGQEINNTTVVN